MGSIESALDDSPHALAIVGMLAAGARVESIFKWVKRGDVMINVNTAGSMSDASWAAFVAELGARDYGRYIGVSLGVLQLSTAQRRQAAAALRGNGVAVVIVTDDVLVRGIVTAVSWLGADVKSFPWSEMHEALAWLGLGGEEGELLEIIEQLKDECVAEERARGGSGEGS